VQIDTREALPVIFPLIVSRRDWSSARVASILREAGAAQVAPYLNKAVQASGPVQLPRLLRYMQAVCPMESVVSIREVLEKAEDDHVISTALQVYSDPSNLDRVRELLRHPRWHIRVQAASALGRLGAPGDEILLARLLSDEQWWVRYRAAQALASLPFLGAEDMRRIQAGQDDRFARDMLDQVIAEASLR
jgi:HEAT repeat protein